MDKPAEPTHDQSPKTSERWGSKTILIIVAACLLFAGVMGGLWFTHHWRNMAEIGVANRVVMTHERGGMGMGGPGFIKHMDGGEETITNPTDGTSRTLLTGVVTQVSASGFTIAGNGTSKVIATNGSTSFVGKDKAAVNDSVMVVGTTSGNSFTATSVQIVNR